MTAKKRMATNIKNRLAQSNRAKNTNQLQQNPMRTSVELVAMDTANGGTDQVIIRDLCTIKNIILAVSMI
jgi:hypothetical protein